MSQPRWDEQGEAREALGAAVESYGERVLGDAHILGNLVADLLPDLPRERNLLVTAAEADVAGQLRRYVGEQHLDADTAVRLAARALAERRSIDAAASTWVVAEYARALGFQPAPAGASPVPAAPEPRYAPPTISAVPAQPGLTLPPALPATPSPGTGGRARRPGRGPLAAVAAGGVVVVYLIVAGGAHLFPFAAPQPARSHGTAPSPTRDAVPSPAPVTRVAPLVQMLPSDIDDTATECTALQPPYGWVMPGVVQAMRCTDPGLSKGYVFAYQLDSKQHYETAWAAFNKWWGFKLSSAGPNCPPQGSATQGTTGFNGKYFPPANGQVLECQMVGSGGANQPAYAWTYPSEWVFLVAQGAAGSSFSSLDSWWSNHSGPMASPSPAGP